MSPTTPGNAAAPLFTITGQRETTQTVAPGQFVPGVTVYFVTRSGTSASVFVPYTAYTADNVRDVVTKRAQEIEAIHQITPSS